MHTGRFRVLVSVLAVTGLMQACDWGSRGDPLEEARRQIAKRDKPAAMITLKEALQKADSAPVRFLLGKTLLDAGQPIEAEVELRKALLQGQAESDVVPELVKALTAMGRADEAIKTYAGKKFDSPAAMAELQVGLAAAWATQGDTPAARRAIDAALQAVPKHPVASAALANMLWSEGKPEAALALIDEVLKQSPQLAQALHAKGVLLRHYKKDIPGAIASQREALKSEPTLVSAHAELLALYYGQGDKAALRAQLDQMRKLMPRSPIAMLFRAQAEYLEGNLRLARDLTQPLLKAKNPDPRALLLAGEIEYRSGAMTLAESYLTRAVNSGPSMDSSRPLLAQIQVRQGHTDKALRTLQPLLDLPEPSANALSIAAEAYLHEGNPAKAQVLLERAARSSPSDPQIRTTMALSRIAQGQAAEGLDALERIASSDKSTFADLALVSVLLRQARLDTALPALVRLEEKDEKSPLASYLRGKVMAAKGDVTAAREAYLKSLKRDETYFPAARALGALDIEAKDLKAAKSRFDAILAKDAGNLYALLAIADLRARMGDPQEAVEETLKQVVAKNPTRVEGRVAYAEYLLRIGKSKEGLQVAQEAVAAIPDDPQLLDVLGRAQRAKGEYLQAVTTFRKLASITPNSPVPQMRLVDLYLERGDRASAIGALRKALDVAPNLLDAQAKQIEFFAAEKRFKEALALAKKIQAARPMDGIGFLLEASVHIDSKQWPAAASALRTSLSKTPSTTAAIRLFDVLGQMQQRDEARRFAAEWEAKHPEDIKFVFQVGTTAMRAGDWPLAEAEFGKVLAVNKEHVNANNNMAWALMNQNKTGALEYAERARKLAPKVPAVMDTYAAALAEAGQIKQAMELQRQVVSMAPDLQDARLTLARIALKAGDLTLARAELDRLAYEGSRYPRQAEVNELLKKLQKSAN
ncbi:XrtA/PEP-CTERM system TPR-repeat protein PrsT [Roseateles paludis]|uniref:XrtA/PEP-CTERM system TPR-repeat protein PrsT n=1 Tax=Roseateles paludis TaxID=3145238 RepID=A0ABV0G038_9BURK